MVMLLRDVHKRCLTGVGAGHGKQTLNTSFHIFVWTKADKEEGCSKNRKIVTHPL